MDENGQRPANIPSLSRFRRTCPTGHEPLETERDWHASQALSPLSKTTPIPMNTNPHTEIAPKEDIVAVLHDLIEISRDGEEGFKQAADHARSSKLKQVFADYSRQRHQFVTELQQLERRFGETEVDESGSATGTLHRAWINLRTAISSRNDQAILDEAERGEDAAKAAFTEAQKQCTDAMPVDVRTAINAQFVQVRQAHDEVRRLRDCGEFRDQPGA